MPSKIACWYCCPIGDLDEAERFYEEQGIEIPIGIHSECKEEMAREAEGGST